MCPQQFERPHPIRPKRLSAGDTIAVAATASPFEPDALYRGAAALEEMGFKTRIPEEVFRKAAYLAGSDLHRADLVNRLFADPSVDGIICARGGYGSLRVVNRLDYQRIRLNPKPFIGFSDVTAVLAALYNRCGMVVFHGPVLSQLASADQETRSSLQAAISSDRGMVLQSAEAIAVTPGRVTAPVLAGNLTTYSHMLATPFAPDFAGHILVFEDHGEAVYRIDRMLTQMKLAGCFDGVAGVVLGSFSNGGHYDDVVAVFAEVFENRPVPMLAGFQVGHRPANLTLPLGLAATLDTDHRQLRFLTAATDE